MRSVVALVALACGANAASKDFCCYWPIASELSSCDDCTQKAYDTDGKADCQSDKDNTWCPSETPSPPPPPSPPAPVPPILVGRCEICPALQTFDDPQFHQNCDDQDRFQWIKDLINKGCNQVWQLEAKTYYMDRQYLLPCGVQVKGAGSGQGGTIIKAVRCETPNWHDYGLGAEGAKYRIGFVLNHNTSISGMRFEGADTERYEKDTQPAVGKSYASEGYHDIDEEYCVEKSFSDLQGGAGFETPGCSDPYACSITPCINGKFTTPAGYKWDPVESIAIKNAIVENIVALDSQNGFFGAPLNEHLGVGQKGFDLNKLRPSNIRVSDFVNENALADGINLHGAFHNILIDGYRTLRSDDDCIALWSIHDRMGAVTIQNSFAGNCGFMGCYTVYGGSGPLTYRNNECAATGSSAGKCLWLDDSDFNCQFASTTHVRAEKLQCNGWTPCGGSAKSFCPKQRGTAFLLNATRSHSEYLV